MHFPCVESRPQDSAPDCRCASKQNFLLVRPLSPRVGHRHGLHPCRAQVDICRQPRQIWKTPISVDKMFKNQTISSKFKKKIFIWKMNIIFNQFTFTPCFPPLPLFAFIFPDAPFFIFSSCFSSFLSCFFSSSGPKEIFLIYMKNAYNFQPTHFIPYFPPPLSLFTLPFSDAPLLCLLFNYILFLFFFRSKRNISYLYEKCI